MFILQFSANLNNVLRLFKPDLRYYGQYSNLYAVVVVVAAALVAAVLVASVAAAAAAAVTF